MQNDAVTQQADSTVKPTAAPVGEVAKQFGPIRLIRQIGKGGMGEVWLARHEFLGREVAVKILSTAVMDRSDPAFKEFIQGAKVAASLGHPGLNKVYHADVADGVPYLVLELLDGRNLQELVKQSGRLDLPTVRAVIEAVGEAVAELHQHGLVHRDLKPSNFMLTTDGRVVVTDFGLACARPVSALRGNSGSVAGTPAYMAPEMFDRVVSARTDVYAIGMTANELLCGHPAFQGTLDELRRQHQTAAINTEPLRAAGVPDGVIDVIVRATCRDILYRPKTARHVLDAFRAAFDAAGIQPASRTALARMLKDRVPSSADQPRGGAASSGNTADTISQFAARKRDLRDVTQLRGPMPTEPNRRVVASEPGPGIPMPAPLAVQQLSYSQPLRRGRPGLVTAIGVLSIVVASLSILFSLQTGLQAVGFLFISRMSPRSSTTTTTPAGSGSVTVSTSVGMTPTTSPTTVATAPSTALTPAEVQTVISKVQANLGAKKLNPAQVASLHADLQGAPQSLVTPGTACSPVTATPMQTDGTASISLSGGFIQIDAKGVVLSRFSNATGFGRMPRFTALPCILGLFDAVASLGLAVMLLVAGIGALRYWQRSLRLHRIFGWAKIPVAVLGGIAYGWMMSQFISSMPALGAFTKATMVFGFYAVCLAGLGCAYPVGLLIALRSGTVRGYYNSITG